MGAGFLPAVSMRPSESHTLNLIHARAKRKLFAFVQAFTACATLLLLTATVTHRADQDGYQAAHLFFVPRQNWEMDEGRGMLHEEEYYRDMDERAMLEEDYGRDADYFEEQEQAQEARELEGAQALAGQEQAQPLEEADEQEQPRELAELRDGEPYDEPSPQRDDEGGLFNSHKPVLRRAPRPRPFISNEMPTVKPVEECLYGAAEPVLVGEPLVYLADWQPDVPSPPPRITPA